MNFFTFFLFLTLMINDGLKNIKGCDFFLFTLFFFFVAWKMGNYVVNKFFKLQKFAGVKNVFVLRWSYLVKLLILYLIGNFYCWLLYLFFMYSKSFFLTNRQSFSSIISRKEAKDTKREKSKIWHAILLLFYERCNRTI